MEKNASKKVFNYGSFNYALFYGIKSIREEFRTRAFARSLRFDISRTQKFCDYVCISVCTNFNFMLQSVIFDRICWIWISKVALNFLRAGWLNFNLNQLNAFYFYNF